MCGERERHLISRFFFFFFIFLGEKIEEFSALAWWDEMKIARNAAIMACDELGDKFEKFVEMAVQFFLKSLKSLKVYKSWSLTLFWVLSRTLASS